MEDIRRSLSLRTIDDDDTTTTTWSSTELTERPSRVHRVASSSRQTLDSDSERDFQDTWLTNADDFDQVSSLSSYSTRNSTDSRDTGRNLDEDIRLTRTHGATNLSVPRVVVRRDFGRRPQRRPAPERAWRYRDR
jgi:hypothetical protein